MMSDRRWTLHLPTGPARQYIVYPVMVGAYSLILFLVYSQLVSPLFAYLGYRYAEPAPVLMVATWVIASLVALTLPTRLDRPSSVVIWMLFAITVAPTILMAPYTSYLDNGTALLLAGTVGLVFAAIALGQNPSPKRFLWSVSPRAMWWCLGVLSLATYLLLIITQGIGYGAVDINAVNETRTEFSEASSHVRILEYAVQTQANVINPMIAALGLLTRRWWVVAAAVAGQLVIYSSTGFKHILFAVLAWLIVVMLLRWKGRRTRGSILLWGASALVLLAAVTDALTGDILATSLFSRRFILTPGLFTSVYVHFFSEHPQAHLGYSVLAPFVDYPYDTTPPFLIGDWMAGIPTMASNANLFADGFANFGWFGMVGAGAILFAYLRWLDRAAVGVPIVVSALVMVIPTVALSNASVLTSMFSHGLVAAFILLAWFPRDSSFRPRHLADPGPPSVWARVASVVARPSR